MRSLLLNILQGAMAMRAPPASRPLRMVSSGGIAESVGTGSSSLYARTPLVESAALAEALGVDAKCYLKMDAFQPSGSFKDRGMALLCSTLADRGVSRFICSSGGNAGHSAAYMGRRVGAQVEVIVPSTTKPIMLEKIRRQGAVVSVVGDNWNEADAHARQLVEDAAGSAAYIPPYEDELLWRGHSSIVDEILEDGVSPDAIFLSVGGGGLLNGVLEGVQRNDLDGEGGTAVFACETKGADSFAATWSAGEVTSLDAITSIATSLGALAVSPSALERGLRHRDSGAELSSVVVSDEDAVSACEFLADEHRVLVEPACGAALAGARALPREALEAMDSIVVVVCGGSAVTMDLLRSFRANL